MYSKHDIDVKFNVLMDTAVSSGLDVDKLDALVAPLDAAILEYFCKDYSEDVGKCIKALSHGLIRSGIKYADGSTGADSFVAPAGWDDLRVVFGGVNDEFMVISEDDFVASITEVVPEAGEDASSAPQEPYYQSELVDEYVKKYSDGMAKIESQLNAIAAAGNRIALGNAIEKLFDPKEILAVPAMGDIAKDIYINKRYKEVIEFYDLNVYIPQIVAGD